MEKPTGPGSAQVAGAIFRVRIFGMSLFSERSKRMARRKVKNDWFVSVAAPKGAGSGRLTETFPTETEAKQFAKERLSEKHHMEKHHIIAGTLLGAYLPVRRIISGSQLCSWVGVKDPTLI